MIRFCGVKCNKCHHYQSLLLNWSKINWLLFVSHGSLHRFYFRLYFLTKIVFPLIFLTEKRVLNKTLMFGLQHKKWPVKFNFQWKLFILKWRHNVHGGYVSKWFYWWRNWLQNLYVGLADTTQGKNNNFHHFNLVDYS